MLKAAGYFGKEAGRSPSGRSVRPAGPAAAHAVATRWRAGHLPC